MDCRDTKEHSMALVWVLELHTHKIAQMHSPNVHRKQLHLALRPYNCRQQHNALSNCKIDKMKYCLQYLAIIQIDSNSSCTIPLQRENWLRHIQHNTQIECTLPLFQNHPNMLRAMRHYTMSLSIHTLLGNHLQPTMEPQMFPPIDS